MMNREEYIDHIAAILVSHDCADYAHVCCCGKHLYAPRDGGLNSEGGTSMRRHRAESIVDALGLGLEVAI